MKKILISSLILGLLHATPSLNKTFYRVIKEKNNHISIDTLTTFQIIDGKIFVDKLSMDWYVIKIDKLTVADFVIEIYASKECDYLDFERNNIKWHNLMSDGDKKTQLKKDVKSFIWEIYRNGKASKRFVVDSLDFPKLNFPVYKY